MKLRILTFESISPQIGKMSNKTYNNLPDRVKFGLTKQGNFFFGDFLIKTNNHD